MKKRFKLLLLLWLASFVLATFLKLAGALKPFEDMMYDYRMKWAFSNTEAPREVAVLLIDEASLKTLDTIVGRWPWPRSIHGEILEFLSIGGARAVVYDVLFTERSTPEEDLALVEKTKENGRVFHAVHLFIDVEDEKNKNLLNRPLPEDFVKRYALKEIYLKKPYITNNYALPYRELYQSTKGIGVVEFAPDPDGTYRRTPLFRVYAGKAYPSMSLSVFIDANGSVRAIEEGNRLNLYLPEGKLSVPYYDGYYAVKMYGKFDAYSVSGVIHSMRQIKMGNFKDLLINPEEFRDKVVFVGASAVGVEDLKKTPMSPTTPGVFLHASIYSNLIKKDFLIFAQDWVQYLTSGVLSLLVVKFMLLRRGLPLRVFLSVFLLVIYFVVCFTAFKFNLVLDLTYPSSAGLLGFFMGLFYVGLSEEREKRRIRNTLGRYVSSAVLADVLSKGEEVLLAEKGVEVELTIMFSDIRGFTDISETLTPERVVDMLNTYFDQVVDLIFESGGTVDKFIGDAILAFWGAPIRYRDHRVRAVSTAIKMLKTLESVNKKLSEKGLPPIKVGFGINTDRVVLGNIGSKKRLDYTVIGDGVNLASRLEGLTKFYGVDIVLSENTAKGLGESFVLRKLDMVRVKGKKEAVSIYQAMEDTEENRKLAQLCNQAFEEYLKRNWDGATELYKAVLELRPEDKTAKLFVERCNFYKENPPPKDWDGVWTFKEK
ncbi:MAG: adenylate/guanylate cyclase domain-containing protein [Aquificaceae bacterium]|nr:adenylate/guanylate cyclase domain-containing protein [Aquificaceae bacterium]